MKNISVVFCFNDSYCTIAAGAISSLIKNTSEQYNYDLYIINDDITVKNRYLINKINNKDNVKILFKDIDITDYYSGELFTRKRFSKNTYSRLFLHRILPSVDKVLYLDGDLIITSDIADLYKTDISNYSVAAAPDKVALVARDDINNLTSMKISRNDPVEEIRVYENYYNYFTQYLGYSHKEIESYFNSGVILFNLKRAGRILDDAPKFLKRRYLTHDQCILNLLFKKDKFILEHRYNVWSSFVPMYINNNGKLPDIIHYHGGPKPLYSMSADIACEYWKAMAITDFYYPAIETLINKKISNTEALIYRKSLVLENKINSKLKDERELTDLFYDLRRINKTHLTRKYIRLIIKLLVDSKKYRKLKTDPSRFFRDSRNAFIRFLGKYYI